MSFFHIPRKTGLKIWRLWSASIPSLVVRYPLKSSISIRSYFLLRPLEWWKQEGWDGKLFRWDGIKCPGSRVWNLPGLEFLFHPGGKLPSSGVHSNSGGPDLQDFWFQKFSTKKKQGGKKIDSPTWTNALLFFLTWGIVVIDPPLTVYIREKGNGRNSEMKGVWFRWISFSFQGNFQVQNVVFGWCNHGIIKKYFRHYGTSKTWMLGSLTVKHGVNMRNVSNFFFEFFHFFQDGGWWKHWKIVEKYSKKEHISGIPQANWGGISTFRKWESGNS